MARNEKPRAKEEAREYVLRMAKEHDVNGTRIFLLQEL